jgi:hypothetical protein
MDYQLIALIGMMAAVVVMATRQQSRAWPGRPGWQYQRVFSTGFAGLLFFIAGLSGWDLKYSHGWLQGTNWVDVPIWWEVILGSGLLMLAVFWARRVPARPSSR